MVSEGGDCACVSVPVRLCALCVRLCACVYVCGCVIGMLVSRSVCMCVRVLCACAEATEEGPSQPLVF